MAKRRYVFTLHNYTCDEYVKIITLCDTESYSGYLVRQERGIRFIVFQAEICPTTNGPHLQGYVELYKPSRFNAASTKICGTHRCSFQQGNVEGSAKQNITYCTKEDTRAAIGLTGRGGIPAKCGGLTKVVDQIHNNRPLSEIIQENPVTYLKHKEKINVYFLGQLGARKNRAPKIFVYVGPTGSGKSTIARQEFPDYYKAPWPTGGRYWWPDYLGQETIIMDEFCHQLKINKLLELWDRWEYTSEFKGGNVKLADTTTTFVVTTNIEPALWYPKAPNHRRAPLCRRINEFGKIYDFEGGLNYPNFVATLREEPLVMARPDPMEIDTENIQPLSQNTRDNMNQYNRPYET